MTSESGNDPLISVTIIFLNGERFIREAIESVVAQTYKNWELFLVDDGSTDDSSQIAMRYAEQYQGRVHYLAHPKHQNRGMSASRNLGISHAKGEYLAFLDADDVWLPNTLERQVIALGSHPEAGMVYGSAQYWYSWTGNPEDAERDFRDFVEERGGAKPGSLLEPPTLLTVLLRDGSAAPCICSVLMRCDVVRAVGGFEEQFRGQYEDQALYIKLALQAPVLVADECWSRYRQHPNSSWIMAQRTGQDRQARRFFMGWLARYLSEQGTEEAEIWQLVERELPQNRRAVAQVKVLDVSKNELAEQLWGFQLDSPQSGQQGDGQELYIRGWVLSRDSPAVAVELVHEGVVVRRVPIDDPRADVTNAFPQVLGAENSGSVPNP